MADHVRTLARAEGIQIRQVNAGERKEALVEEILAVRGRCEGVVCILGAIERCRCFKVGKNQTTGFVQLQWSPGKCQHFYVYFKDAEFGLCHLRIPTWAPFRLQFCCNGHDWLERQMRSAGLRFKKADNCFTHVGDFAAAQALLKKFEPAAAASAAGPDGRALGGDALEAPVVALSAGAWEYKEQKSLPPEEDMADGTPSTSTCTYAGGEPSWLR